MLKKQTDEHAGQGVHDVVQNLYQLAWSDPKLLNVLTHFKPLRSMLEYSAEELLGLLIVQRNILFLGTHKRDRVVDQIGEESSCPKGALMLFLFIIKYFGT